MLQVKIMMSYLESLVKMLIAAMFVVVIASGSAFASEIGEEPVVETAPIVEVVEETPAAEPIEVVVEEAAADEAPAVEAEQADETPVVEEAVAEPQAEAQVESEPVAQAEAAIEAQEEAAPVEQAAATEAVVEEAPVEQAAEKQAQEAVADVVETPAAVQAAAPAAQPAKSAPTMKAAAAVQAPTLTDEAGNAINAVNGIYNINASGTYTFNGYGQETSDIIKIQGASSTSKIDVILNLVDAVIKAAHDGESAIAISNAIATLNIAGECMFTGALNGAGIEVNDTASLQMYAAEEGASVTAIGNAGIDYSSKAEYNQAVKDGTYGQAAGIGGTKAKGSVGTIEIGSNDAPRLEVSATAGGRGAAGIGSVSAAGSDIIITNVDLNTVHGGFYQAIGEGDGSAFKNTLEGGPAIGAGTKGGQGGTVTIVNCTGTDIVGGGKCAGIGGGIWSSEVEVHIVDSNLEVTGGMTGAAIGTGRAETGTKLNVLIEGSTIVAQGGDLGAGIGLGCNGSNYALDMAYVTISDSNVVATGGAGAAGIGGGRGGYNVSVSILGESDVKAFAGKNYMAKYTTLENKSGAGQSGAAGIGRGAWGSVNFANGTSDSGSPDSHFSGAYANRTENAMCPVLVIDAAAKVQAFSSGDNMAIAGFGNTEGVESAILQIRFARNYDLTYKGQTAENDFIDHSWDDANAENWTACYLDGQSETALDLRDADTKKTLLSVVIPAAGAEFANGYTGEGRLGYYSVAITAPEAGEYKLSTGSEVRGADDAVMTMEDEGYMGGASYQVDAETRSDVFAVAQGLNTFDWGAFRDAADPEPEPEPEPVVEPETEPEVAPAVEPEAEVEPEPETESEVAPAAEPEAKPAPTAEPGAEEAPTAGPETSEVPGADTATVASDEEKPAASENQTVIADEATPLAPVAVVAAPAATVAAAAIADEAVPMAAPVEIADEVTPLVETVAIPEDEIPMAAFEEENCWVHWWMMLGAALTSLYGLIVVARRQRNSNELQAMDDEVMGVVEEAQATAPAFGTIAQPAM